jgi:hypothetical protein
MEKEMSDVENLLNEGITALKAGQRTKARALLQEVVRQRPDDVTAWLWLSGAVEMDAERRQCLEKVLVIDPKNPHAQRGLEKLSVVAPRQKDSESSPSTVSQDPATQLPTEYCPHCGAKIQKGKQFCAICGKKLVGSVVAPSRSAKASQPTSVVSRKASTRSGVRKKKRRKRLTFWAASGLLLISLCCCGAVLVNLMGGGTGTSNGKIGTSPRTRTSGSAGATVSEWEGVYIGMPADDVLWVHPREETTEAPETIDQDSEGLVVRWSYPGAYLILARRWGECPLGVDESRCYCYRVMEIYLR